MKRILASLAAAALLAGPIVAVDAQAQSRDRQPQRGEQESARAQMQAGRNLPIREIEQRILPRMRGDEYLGFEYDPAAQAYRLKFIREGRLIWVDVDAQTARVLRVSQ
jgi:Ni/Co efflux regulator RcnB